MQASNEILKDDSQQDDARQPSVAVDQVCVYLIESGRLKQVDLDRAEAFREQNGGELITLLVRLGLVSERDVAEAESSLLELPLRTSADLPEKAPDVGKLSIRFLKQNLLLPVSITDTAMVVVGQSKG